MKTSSIHRRRGSGKSGFASYVLVLSTCAVLTFLMLSAYRRAMAAHDVQKTVQLRTDYSEKDDAILRSIVAIAPNRAMRAMQHNSNSSTAISEPLRWQNILKEALVLSNARKSIPDEIRGSISISNPKTGGNVGLVTLGSQDVLNTVVLRSGNAGDSVAELTDTTLAKVFKTPNQETGVVAPGINRSLGTAYPPPLTVASSSTSSLDRIYPIITAEKEYGTLAQGGVDLSVETYKKFNRIKYPQINFGYARPGQPFVAKRNWWAFTLDTGAQDFVASSARPGRDFVLSIYEIPSQLAISASSFMALGQYQSGEEWGDKVNISGGVFAGKALVQGQVELPALASRRGMSLSRDAKIDGQSFTGNPFQPGIREAFRVNEGDFFPVSLASESGRVAFIPINRGAEFFDRFAHTTESQTVSPTTWNNYSVGALQCAMRVDITKVKSTTNKEPTELRFSYIGTGTAGRQTYVEPLVTGISAALPPGYVKVADENQTYNFGTQVVDVAYGMNGKYYFQTDVTGVVAFNKARFGDPIVGTFKAGYFRTSAPYKVKLLPSGKTCIAIYPQRIPAFLARINANTTAVNHSLVVNVDYTNVGLVKPSIPCTDLDYGVILEECADLTPFPNGFSLVTNLRTYIGDDFNVVPYSTAPPLGYVPPDGKYLPPASLFTPEKRYGVLRDPFGVKVDGQVGSLASETNATPVNPLESKTLTGTSLAADRITVNLRPITHPAELPPITMMNWLVVLEEQRKEFAAN
jgi:hypothetical protein